MPASTQDLNAGRKVMRQSLSETYIHNIFYSTMKNLTLYKIRALASNENLDTGMFSGPP